MLRCLSIMDNFGTLILALIIEVFSQLKGHLMLQYYTETWNGVLTTEVSSTQRSLNKLQYYDRTRNGVLITVVYSIQRFLIERSHCNFS